MPSKHKETKSTGFRKWCYIAQEASSHLSKNFLASNQTNIYLFKVKNQSTKKRCEICSNLTTKTPS